MFFSEFRTKILVYVLKQGKFQATVVCCILGVGALVSWNSILTIADYYYLVFPVRFLFRFGIGYLMFCFCFPRKSLKTFMLFVGLSSFKGTNTCIPAVCACNSCDSCISRIENQYPETQHDWLHYIHNFLVIANSCKSKPNLFFYLTIKKLDLDYGLKTLINLKTVGLGNKRTWWNRTVSRSMHNRCFFRPRRCYRSRRNDRRFILDVP